jgi:hypothetical protein
MWFGNTNKFQWVPCPLIGSTVTRKRYVSRLQFENGGGDVTRSSAYQMEYNLSINGLAHDVEGVDVFNKYASGFYGDGYIYMAHPAAYETNLFSAAWATPASILYGFPNFSKDTSPTYPSPSNHDYDLPSQSVTFDIPYAADALSSDAFIIPIPPTHTLYIGATGSKTGTAVVQVVPYANTGIAGSVTNLTLINTSSNVRMNASFAGSSYAYVAVYLTKTSSAASTITLNSMMARLYPSSVTPNLTGNHYQGEGSTGLMFADDAIVENYSYMYPPRKGISTTLVEVEAWR